jgi:hypothetical protein
MADMNFETGPRPGPRPGPRAGGLRDPQTRRMLLIAGAALLALLLILALWSSTGSRGARGDLRAANERILEKRGEVEEARQVLEQRLAELREAEAAAIAEDERLDATLVRERRTGTAAGEVVPLVGNEEQRAEESLRRSEERLREGARRP